MNDIRTGWGRKAGLLAVGIGRDSARDFRIAFKGRVGMLPRIGGRDGGVCVCFCRIGPDSADHRHEVRSQVLMIGFDIGGLVDMFDDRVGGRGSTGR